MVVATKERKISIQCSMASEQLLDYQKGKKRGASVKEDFLIWDVPQQIEALSGSPLGKARCAMIKLLLLRNNNFKKIISRPAKIMFHTFLGCLLWNSNNLDSLFGLIF